MLVGVGDPGAAVGETALTGNCAGAEVGATFVASLGAADDAPAVSEDNALASGAAAAEARDPVVGCEAASAGTWAPLGASGAAADAGGACAANDGAFGRRGAAPPVAEASVAAVRGATSEGAGAPVNAGADMALPSAEACNTLNVRPPPMPPNAGNVTVAAPGCNPKPNPAAVLATA